MENAQAEKNYDRHFELMERLILYFDHHSKPKNMPNVNLENFLENMIDMNILSIERELSEEFCDYDSNENQLTIKKKFPLFRIALSAITSNEKALFQKVISYLLENIQTTSFFLFAADFLGNFSDTLQEDEQRK